MYRRLVSMYSISSDGKCNTENATEEVNTGPPDKVWVWIPNGGYNGSDKRNQPGKLRNEFVSRTRKAFRIEFGIVTMEMEIMASWKGSPKM